MSKLYSYEDFAENLEHRQDVYLSKQALNDPADDLLAEAYAAGGMAWASHETPADMATVTDRLQGKLKEHFLRGLGDSLDCPQNIFSRPAQTMRDWVERQLTGRGLAL